MPDDRPQPFDEKAALEELERLREAREAARRIHQEKAEAFERLIQSVPTPQPSGPRVQPGIGSSAHAVARDARVTPSEPVTLPTLSPAADTRAAASPPAASRRAGRSPRGWRIGTLVALGAAAVVVIALAVPRGRSRMPDVVPAATTPGPVSETPPAPIPTPAPAPAAVMAPAAAPDAVRVELRTAAPVWMRVVVDGDTRMERVAAAGERLSWDGHRSVVVRAGNAGDVFVVTNGREAPFGVAGRPLTRTFVPSPAGPVSQKH